MRYTVIWGNAARKKLAAIWLNLAQLRREIANAADAVDRDLSDDPDSKGGSLSEGLRVIVSGPLRIVFSVRADDRIAEIESVSPAITQELDPD